MKLLNFFKNGLKNFSECFKRFPVSICFAVITTVIAIILVNGYDFFDIDDEILSRIAAISALGVPLFLCIRMLFERCPNIKTVARKSGYTIGAVFLVLYYFFLFKEPNMVSVTRYAAVTIALYLGFMFIPYFYKRDNYELYVIKLFTRAFITVIYSVILVIGLAAIIFALDKLLGIDFPSEIYVDMWFITVGIFAPCFFLSGVPKTEQQFDNANYPSPFKVLLLYIVMPLLTAYTVILYIYFVKIIVTHQWPMGLVTHLVLWYSVINTAVLFFIAPLTSENKWANFFHFWMSKLILPLLVMMFISIGIRIKEYGITENRYYVVLLGCWVTGVLIYLNLSKVKRNINLPISLAIISVLSVFGPWSCYSISKFSQSKRLEAILDRNNMLVKGTVSKPVNDISKADRVEISQILSYFDNNHELSDIKYLPDNFDLNNMKDIFGFVYEPYSRTRSEREYTNFSFYTDAQGNFINVIGYDYLYDLRGGYSKTETETEKLNVEYNYENTEVRIYYEGAEIYRKDLSVFGKQLHEQYGSSTKPMSVDKLTFTDENAKLKLKYVLTSIYGEKDAADNSIDINSIDGYMLIKMK